MSDDTNLDPTTDELGLRYIRQPGVLAMTGLTRASLYKLIREGTFPKPYALGPRTTAWKAGEVIAWMSSRPLSTARFPQRLTDKAA